VEMKQGRKHPGLDGTTPRPSGVETAIFLCALLLLATLALALGPFLWVVAQVRGLLLRLDSWLG
jgi:hypothetical protein